MDGVLYENPFTFQLRYRFSILRSLREDAINTLGVRTYGIKIMSASSSVSRSEIRLQDSRRASRMECQAEKDDVANGPETSSKNSSQATRLLKTKQGLVGFANGSKIAAMADTGSRKNVMSESHAQRLGLTIEGSPSTFETGNSKKIQSTGMNRHRVLQRPNLG